MCNIAGYVGTKPAAPILIEMMRKEEGYSGGYYTGIATIDEGKVYHAKISGDLKRLLDYTDAAHLGGTVGLLHSRSRSGGGDEWAQPYIGTGGHVAYIANGAAGLFATDERNIGQNDMARELAKQGYHCRTRVNGAVGRYPQFDGTSVHSSDLCAQLMAKYIDEGIDASEALDRAHIEMPSEKIGLAIYDAEPDCIIWSRVNYPMFVGFADHGAYIATTPIAFPDDVRDIVMTDTNAGGRVYADRMETNAYKNADWDVAPITAEVFEQAYDACVKLLSEKLCGVGDLNGAVKPFLAPAFCQPIDALSYAVMAKLHKEGRLITEVNRIPEAVNGVHATRFKMRLAQ